MKPGDEGRIYALVSSVFSEFVASEYLPEGIEEFINYIQPEDIASRAAENHFVFVAESGSEIVGVIEIRNSNHISLLFAEKRFQRRGVGKELLRKSVEVCRREVPGLERITVHSSPNAVLAYEKMGFEPSGSERTFHGIRFVPMTCRLEKGDSG